MAPAHLGGPTPGAARPPGSTGPTGAAGRSSPATASPGARPLLDAVAAGLIAPDPAGLLSEGTARAGSGPHE